MDSEDIFEAQLGEEFRKLAGSYDHAEPTQAWKRVQRTSHHHLLRDRVLLCAGLALLAVGLVFGVRELVQNGVNQPSIIITDQDVLTPTSVASPADLSASSDDVPPPYGAQEVTAYLEYATTGVRPIKDDPRFSFVWPSGQEWGLWAGNVDVFPAGTDRLPPEFYQEPPNDGLPELPDFITQKSSQRIAFVEPDSIPRPLWVFATDGDLTAAAGAMVAAVEAGRPVLVVGASGQSVADILRIPPDENQPQNDVVAARTIVRYAPWKAKPLAVGEIVPADYWVQPPKEIDPEPTPTEIYDFLALATLQADAPALSEEESTARLIEDGWYFGFWAGNVEVIPEQSAHLPDFFYSGPTPLPGPRTDRPSAFVDPTAINKPLWVMGDEVDPLDYADRIRAAAAADRPVMFYATTEEVAEAAMGIKDNASGSSSAPLSLQIRPWWPWQTWSGLGTYSWSVPEAEEEMSSPAWVFRMLADTTLQPPRAVENTHRSQPLSRDELADILAANYRGIDMMLALPSVLADDFVVAEGYRPSSIPGGASAGSGAPVVVDCPNISPTWWGVRYTTGEESFWLLTGLCTAPTGAAWREVGTTTSLDAVSVAEWGDVTWVRVGGEDSPVFLVGSAAVEEAMVAAAISIAEMGR